jgi:hypothetical protein
MKLVNIAVVVDTEFISSMCRSESIGEIDVPVPVSEVSKSSNIRIDG